MAEYKIDHVTWLMAYTIATFLGDLRSITDYYVFSAKKWWHFAIDSTLHFIREKAKRQTIKYIAQRAHDILLYREAYMQQLKVGSYYVESRHKVS